MSQGNYLEIFDSNSQVKEEFHVPLLSHSITTFLMKKLIP